MFKTQSLLRLYKDFYDWMEKPEMFQKRPGNKIEYSDVFPLVYIKIAFQGTMSFSYVKHLVVDEMQDYTPVQYAVLSLLFKCKKTILGDANQSVNPYSSTTHHEIQKVFDNAVCMKLSKSYRSSYEITSFAQNISKNEQLEAIERHGEKPALISVESETQQLSEIKRLLENSFLTDYQSLAVICKSQIQAQSMHDALQSFGIQGSLLTPETKTFSNGIIITTAHMAKGLEFDQVIIPFADAKNYKSEIDRSMQYNACTRAMHKLDLISVGESTPFIDFAKDVKTDE